jgi:hypothetical protein
MPPDCNNSSEYIGMQVRMTSGKAANEVRTITAHDAHTSSITVKPAWEVTPQKGDTYEIFEGVVKAYNSRTGRITLSKKAPAGRPYLRIVSGAGGGQDDRSLRLVSGATYVVSPPFGKGKEEKGRVPDKTSRYLFYGPGYSGVPDAEAKFGYWNWGDTLGQSHVWIHGPTKHGLLSFPTLTMEHHWYSLSDLRGRQHGSYWFVYDPKDLLAVVRGKQQANRVVPRWWEAEYSDAAGKARTGYLGRESPFPARPPRESVGAGRYGFISGAVYDPQEKRLYLLGYFYPDRYRVYVYRVDC